MPEWFEDWFASDEYLTVYKHRDDTDAKLLGELITQTLNVKNYPAVLDFACGAGRHSILFAQKGYNVTGVDLSKNLLDMGIERSASLGLNISFLLGDLRYFSITKKFNIILNLFTSFGYFVTDKENFQPFVIAYKHLLPGGYFVFDYFNAKYIRENLNKYTVDLVENYKITQKRSIVDERVVKEIVIKGTGKGKKFFESVRLYDSSVIIKQLEATGFVIEKIYGGYTGEVFNENTSKRLVIFAKK